MLARLITPRGAASPSVIGYCDYMTFRVRALLVSLSLLATSRAALTTRYVDVNSTNGAQCVSSSLESIPWSEIGAKAGVDYHGDALSVMPVPQSRSAGLRCAFQGLEGEATTNGLWLRSTVTNAPRDRFRV